MGHNFDGDHCDPHRPLLFLCRDVNEASASQCLTSRDRLGIDPAKSDVNGGAIAILHLFGMTSARRTGHLLQEGAHHKAKWGVVTMCIGGGQGGAGMFEIYS